MLKPMKIIKEENIYFLLINIIFYNTDYCQIIFIVWLISFVFVIYSFI